MTFCSRHLAGFLVALCFYSSNVLADRVYQLPQSQRSVSAGSVSILSTSLRTRPELVVDSIPQLGIVITREPLSQDEVTLSEVSDLGNVGRIHLIAPRIGATSLTVPSKMWGLRAINLGTAWKVSKGAGVVVAVSDTGVSANHSALASQMWKNPGEVGADARGKAKSSNKIDDDGNGYIDDVYGWDFVNKKPSGVDHHYHGTHVSGTIAATATKSMAGIAPSAKIMDVSFLDKDGSGDDVNAAKTIVYAVDQGAKIINCSWGCGGKNAILEKAIVYAQKHGVLIMAAAGNEGADNDQVMSIPSNYNYDNIIAVGATTDASGSIASFSNFGLNTVDLAAPGQDIYSLAPHNSYQLLSGTSMATPHVSGVAALVWSAHPSYTAKQVRKALMAVKLASAWKKKSVTGGILDAALAVTH